MRVLGVLQGQLSRFQAASKTDLVKSNFTNQINNLQYEF